MLEALDLARFGAVLQFGKGGELEELIVGAADVDGAEGIGVKTALSLELGDDLVAAALNAEAVHVVATQESAKVGAYLLEVETEGRDFVTVEGDLDLRLVVLEVTVGEDEDAACEGCFHKVVGRLEKLAGLHGG